MHAFFHFSGAGVASPMLNHSGGLKQLDNLDAGGSTASSGARGQPDVAGTLAEAEDEFMLGDGQLLAVDVIE